MEDGRLRAWKMPGGHRRILLDSVERLVEEQRRAGRRAAAGASSVLVLRESPKERRALQELLQTVLPDCTIWAVASGFEGLIRIGEIRPDVLITDLGVTGLDFFRMIHALLGHAGERRMAVVVLLASGADRPAVRARLHQIRNGFHCRDHPIHFSGSLSHVQKIQRRNTPHRYAAFSG